MCYHIFNKCIWTNISCEIGNNHTYAGCHNLAINLTNNQMMIDIIYNILPCIS